jgi:bifunctional DNA-binding transcriptional regulator/antitoxin component of YhaV-PrlF toxin-antitoxin module
MTEKIQTSLDSHGRIFIPSTSRNQLGLSIGISIDKKGYRGNTVGYQYEDR